MPIDILVAPYVHKKHQCLNRVTTKQNHQVAKVGNTESAPRVSE